VNKDKIEAMFRRAGLKPEERIELQDFNVFIADGFSLPPHMNVQRFGVEPLDFPKGCYVTFWWAGKDEKLHAGRPLFFDALHENSYDLETKKKSRLQAALKDAEGHIDMWKRNALNG
jgi:hypothetical protein